MVSIQRRSFRRITSAYRSARDLKPNPKRPGRRTVLGSDGLPFGVTPSGIRGRIRGSLWIPTKALFKAVPVGGWFRSPIPRVFHGGLIQRQTGFQVGPQRRGNTRHFPNWRNKGEREIGGFSPFFQGAQGQLFLGIRGYI